MKTSIKFSQRKKICGEFSKELLNPQFEKKMKLGDVSKEVQILPCMNPIENLNLNGCSFNKRMYGPTMLKEKELSCVKTWK